MATKADPLKSDAILVPRPECDPGPLHEGCDGPPPTPWLDWKHCFKIYEFREYVIQLGTAAALREGIKIRARFEHAMCPMGRKQGPIVHSQTLLPQEEIKIYEYDRYRRATSTSARFSQRSNFFSYVSKVTESLASVKTDFGTAFSSTASVAGSTGGGIDLGIFSFGGDFFGIMRDQLLDRVIAVTRGVHQHHVPHAAPPLPRGDLLIRRVFEV